LLAGGKGIPLSLVGAQGKLAVKISEGRFFLPLDGSPTLLADVSTADKYLISLSKAVDEFQKTAGWAVVNLQSGEVISTSTLLE